MQTLTGLPDWIYNGQAQIRKRVKDDEINSDFVLSLVIHQPKPAHDLPLKSVIQRVNPLVSTPWAANLFRYMPPMT